MLMQRQLEYFAGAVAVVSVFLNVFLLSVMLKTKTIRENPANCFIFTILSFDLISGIYFTGYNYVVRVGLKFLDKSTLKHTFLKGHPANNVPAAVCINFAVFFTLLTIQLAMSAERAWVICFPLSYAIHKDDGYRKWIVTLSIFLGFLFGLMYRIMLERGKGDFYETNMSYKGMAAIWAIGFTALILIFNGLVICKTIKRVSYRLNSAFG